ncbi:MAG: DUF1559 domain-containing protein [Planctomycetia bacterium]|nr:DUF1559 domain-containing protein [Planctomycetia bacterium]
MLPRPRRRCGFNRVEAITCLAMSCIALCIIGCGLSSSREAANRISCTNNLRMLGIALHTYHDAQNRFPTEAGANPSFYKPLLPYLEQANAPDNAPIKEFLCPTRRNPAMAPGKRDYGYAASNGAGTAGTSVLDSPDGVTLNSITSMNGTPQTLLLSHLWLDPQNYAGGDPTDLGWATKNNSRSFNNVAKPDGDATGSPQYLGGPHPNITPSLFADAHVANMPYGFAQWAQAWAWTNTKPIQGLP